MTAKVHTNRLLEKTLSELREYFLNLERPVPDGILEALGNDPRSGARKLAQSIRLRRLKNRKEGQRLRNLLRFESDLYERGFQNIAGVDEAGMAPLAGPVVAAAVILPRSYKLPDLNDSKKISNKRKREELALQIKRDAVCWSIGSAEVEEIDRINIYRAGLLAMRRAVEALAATPDYLLIDARTIPQYRCPQKGIIHGDALSASIAAASIIAKTTRDHLMIEMDRMYTGYGFASHKGYPTPAHLRVLKERGPIHIHRKSFAPVRDALDSGPVQGVLFNNRS